MATINEFNYRETNQRKITLLNSLFTYILTALFFTEITLSINKFFPYNSFIGFSFLFFYISHLIGNLTGKFIFHKIKNSKKLLPLIDLCFFALFSLFFLKDLIIPAPDIFFLKLFLKDKSLFLAIMFLFPFFCGLKHNYFLKVLSGTFFDNKNGLSFYITSILTGIIIGILLGIYSFSDNIEQFDSQKYPYYLNIIIAFATLITSFFIKLSYFPKTFVTQELHKEETKKNKTEFREDILFSILNFTYYIIYIFLGLKTIIKYNENSIKNTVTFILLVFALTLLGFFISRFFKKAVWYIYSEMFYPFLFLCFFIFCNNFDNSIGFFYKIAVFSPICVLFGSTLYHTVFYISNKYSQNTSNNIINLSIFLIPLPVIIIFNFVSLKNNLFFIIFYLVSLFNFLLPGIHLFIIKKQQKVKQAIYIFSFITIIPIFILIHWFFKFNFNSENYVNKYTNIESLNSINFNNLYISENETIKYNKTNIFTINNSLFHSYHKILTIPPLFFDENTGNFLFIDGNIRFYNNNIYKAFNNSYILNYTPPEDDKNNKNQTLTSHRSSYPKIIEKSIVQHLITNNDKYNSIIDIPNLYDQTNDPFRFSEKYYKLCKESLDQNGIFIQVTDFEKCNSSFLVSAINNLKKLYTQSYVFIFTNQLAIVNTNNVNFKYLNKTNLENYSNFLKKNNLYGSIFYDDVQFFSNLIFTDIETLSNFFSINKTNLNIFDPLSIKYIDLLSKTPEKPKLNKLKEIYFSTNNEILSIYKDDEKNYQKLNKKLAKEKENLYLLKIIESAESNKSYQDEMFNSFILQKASKYNKNLDNYISPLIDFKFKHYFKSALKLESSKNWEKAQEIYKAILNVNNNNFEANYRMGILSLTLQKLDEAFFFLNKAMSLNPNHPDVLYQMGVLFFANGKFRESLENLNRALAFQNNDSSTYYYIGLCYEQLGRLRDSKDSYKKALQKDPNNQDFLAALERVEQKIKEEISKWDAPIRKNDREAEQGEVLDLPINKSALDKRLEDLPPDEAKNYKKR